MLKLRKWASVEPRSDLVNILFRLVDCLELVDRKNGGEIHQTTESWKITLPMKITPDDKNAPKSHKTYQNSFLVRLVSNPPYV